MSDFDEELRAALDAMGDRSTLAQSIYDALVSTGKLSSHRVLTYRCRQRCRLLEVLRTPRGIILAVAGYKLSPTANTSTAPSARAKRTVDGDRRWMARAIFIEDAYNVGLNCDHVRSHVLDLATIEADLAAGRSEVVVAPIHP